MCPLKALKRMISLPVLMILMSLLTLPVQAQDTLIVAPDGSYPTIDAALAAANPGDSIEVHGGVYSAPLIIDKTVSIIGIDRPVIDGQGKGSLVLINAPEVTFSGFIVRGSGQSLTHEDTGIVIQAPGVTLKDNILEDVLFGIYFANASNGLAENNFIYGKDLEESMRGDGIRVWYSNNVQIIGNMVTKGRDTLIWYSDDITICDNHIHQNRYGLHFMYNENATVQDNIIEHNTVGAYMMYSAGLVMTGNRYIDNRGASGYGVALKDMDHAHVAENVFMGNMTAIYLDNSPSLVDEYNTFNQNFIAYNDIGLVGLPSVQRNIFQSNTFLENHQQVSVQGRGNLLKNIWNQDGTGNYWSDYIGYDGDANGVGDLSYRSEKLFESLTDSEPILRLFSFSPASQAVDFAASAFPSLRPDPKLIDEEPMMQYTLPAVIAAPTTGPSLPLLAVTLFLTGIGASICIFSLRRRTKLTLPAPQTQAVQAGI